jgi:ankyrin repeat protein
MDANGNTPLLTAARDGHATLVAFLLRNHADYSICDLSGESALHWAAYKGHVDVVALLVFLVPEYLDFPDRYGQTPLHLAALRGNYAAVEFLVYDAKASSM